MVANTTTEIQIKINTKINKVFWQGLLYIGYKY